MLKKELENRYRAVQTAPLNSEVLRRISDYFDLLEGNSIVQKLLAENLEKYQSRKDQLDREAWEDYNLLYKHVYTLLKNDLSAAKKKFWYFFLMDHAPERSMSNIVYPPCWFAIFYRSVYRERLANIHERVSVMVTNQELLDTHNKVNNLSFDPSTSTLYLGEFVVQIDQRSERSYQHKLLEWIFLQEDKTREFDFAEMAKFVTGDEYDKNGKRYWGYVDEINKKVRLKTKGKIDKFFKPSSSKTGYISIHPDVFRLVG